MTTFEPDPRTLVRRTDALTSQRAAVDVLGSPRQAQRVRILEAIRSAGDRGLTWEQAGEATAVTNAWRRVSDLLNAGLIEPVRDGRGLEVTRSLSSGRRGRVYRLPTPASGPGGQLGLFGGSGA